MHSPADRPRFSPPIARVVSWRRRSAVSSAGGIAVALATMVEGIIELKLGDEVLTMLLVVVACGYLALEKDLVNT